MMADYSDGQMRLNISKLMYFPSALDLLGLLLYHLLWLVILADLCMALFTQLYSFLRLPMY